MEAADPAEPIGWTVEPGRPDADTAWRPQPPPPADPLGLTREQRTRSDVHQFAESIGAGRRRIDLDSEGGRRRPLPYDFTGDALAND